MQEDGDGRLAGVSIAFHHMVRPCYIFCAQLERHLEFELWDCDLAIDGRVGYLLGFLISLWIRLYLGVMGVELSSICVS